MARIPKWPGKATWRGMSAFLGFSRAAPYVLNNRGGNPNQLTFRSPNVIRTGHTLLDDGQQHQPIQRMLSSLTKRETD